MKEEPGAKRPAGVPPLPAPHLPASTVGELYRLAALTPEVAHASLLRDLQLMQIALSLDHHRSVLCWQPQQRTPFVLRLGTVTLSLRQGVTATLQDRLSLQAADGSLRPVRQGELEFYSREFIAPASPDLVPVLTCEATGEALRVGALEHVAGTARLAAARTAVLTVQRRLVTAGLLGLLACLLTLVWAGRVSAAILGVLSAAPALHLALTLRATTGTVRGARQRHCELGREIVPALTRVPVGPAVLPGTPPVPEYIPETV